MGRKRHNWHPDASTRGPDGSLTSRCKNCGLLAREGFYASNGRVYTVLQWSTPDGRLLAIRPVVDIAAPKLAPPLDAAFPGVPIAGMPDCPKSVEAWSTSAG